MKLHFEIHVSWSCVMGINVQCDSILGTSRLYRNGLYTYNAYLPRAFTNQRERHTCTRRAADGELCSIVVCHFIEIIRCRVCRMLYRVKMYPCTQRSLFLVIQQPQNTQALC